MGSKLKPGRFDCHAAALPDEPMFVLLARDPLAPMLVDLWGAIRVVDDLEAFDSFRRLLAERHRYLHGGDQDKAEEAFQCASDMRNWRAENVGRWLSPPCDDSADRPIAAEDSPECGA